jgi:hypothetical protein
MRRTRQVIAVMLVTTALCADRGAAALSVATQPQARTQADVGTGVSRGSFLQRLTRNLGGRVSVVLHRQVYLGLPQMMPADARAVDDSATVPHLPVSPFQFRLPPPSC